MPHPHGRPAARRAHRSVAGGEYITVVVRQPGRGTAGLRTRTLLDEQEFPARGLSGHDASRPSLAYQSRAIGNSRGYNARLSCRIGSG